VALSPVTALRPNPVPLGCRGGLGVVTGSPCCVPIEENVILAFEPDPPPPAPDDVRFRCGGGMLSVHDLDIVALEVLVMIAGPNANCESFRLLCPVPGARDESGGLGLSDPELMECTSDCKERSVDTTEVGFKVS